MMLKKPHKNRSKYCKPLLGKHMINFWRGLINIYKKKKKKAHIAYPYCSCYACKCQEMHSSRDILEL